jgi:hypothetical protein
MFRDLPEYMSSNDLFDRPVSAVAEIVGRELSAKKDDVRKGKGW